MYSFIQFQIFQVNEFLFQLVSSNILLTILVFFAYKFILKKLLNFATCIINFCFVFSLYNCHIIEIFACQATMIKKEIIVESSFYFLLKLPDSNINHAIYLPI